MQTPHRKALVQTGIEAGNFCATVSDSCGLLQENISGCMSESWREEFTERECPQDFPTCQKLWLNFKLI